MDRNVFWLVPAAEFRKPLLRLITDLAGAHHAPVFAPHVTLGALRSNDQPGFDDMCTRLERTVPLKLEAAGIETGREFTHCLFVNFARSLALEALVASFPHATRIEPHLSLLYCPPEKRNTGVCDAVDIPFPVIEFNQVWVVPMAGVVRTSEDVTGWQASERIPLSG